MEDTECKQLKIPIPQSCEVRREITGKRTRAHSHSSVEENGPSSERNEALASKDRSLRVVRASDIDRDEPVMTYERCIVEARQYNAMSKFQRWSKKAYRFAVQNDFLDDICAHLLVKGDSQAAPQVPDNAA